MNWSPWLVWLKPRRAFNEIAEYARSDADLSARLQETTALLEGRVREVEELTARNAATGSKLEASEENLKETESRLRSALEELAEARSELSAHRSLDEKQREFAGQLSAIEKMKHDYEKRITELEARLADARMRLAEKEDNELIDPIDMTTGLPPGREEPSPGLQLRKPEQPAKRPTLLRQKNKAGRDEDDWLLELPDF